MTQKRESKKSMALFNLLIKVVYASLFIETSADPCGRVDSQQRRKAQQVPSVGCNGEQPGPNGNCAARTGPGRIVNWTRITGTTRGCNGNQSEREPRTRKGIISPIPMKLGDPPALANFIKCRATFKIHGVLQAQGPARLLLASFSGRSQHQPWGSLTTCARGGTKAYKQGACLLRRDTCH